MDYENKKTLVILKQMVADGKITQEDAEKYFPELKKTDDEKIRKEIIATIHLYYGEPLEDEAKEMIAWLEKQGEKEINDNDISVLENWENAVKENKEKWQLSDWFVEATSLLVRKVEYMGQGIKNDSNKTMLNACINALRNVGHQHLANWLEKQGEQKPTDKIEPKFKVGDWVVYCNEDVDLITGIKENGYCINNGGYIPFVCESDIRLWTIQDAKDGDVLVDGDLPFIFKKIDTNKYCYAYCGISVDDGFRIKSEGKLGEWTWMQDIKPATKEQRDLLFQKIHEAVYEWDAEKKELKKIEQKEDNNLTDFEVSLKHVMEEAIECGDTHNLKADAELLISIAYKQFVEKSAEWSDEDKDKNEAIVSIIRQKYDGTNIEEKKYYNTLINWLKSLRPQKQWKPSEEQMAQLGWITKQNKDNMIGKELMSLYQDLKKLRKE